ncbi:hypothetical protein ABBQ38_011012 [Trebouxia sp. C0009 RCD-2024]
MQKPVVAGWNNPTREYFDVPSARQSKYLSRIRSHGACGLILAVVLRLFPAGWTPTVLAVSTMQGWLLYALAWAVLTAILRYLVFVALKKPAWESKLSNMQRRLLGIAVTPEHADTPLRHRLTQPTQAQPAPQPMKSPLGAPNRSIQAISSPAQSGTPRTPYYADTAIGVHSPYSPYTPPYSTGRPSPFGSAEVVTTQRQCSRYVESFDTGTKAAAAESPYGTASFSPYDQTAGMQSSAGMTLLAGGNVPTYHPSLVPRGRAGSPHAPDMGLHPTSPEALDDLLRQLKTDRHTLETWVDRFRVWMASEVLKKLLAAADTAHMEVKAACAAVGYNMDIISLDEATLASPDRHQSSAAGDQSVHLANLKGRILEGLHPTAPANDPRRKCVEVIHKYQRLGELLQGEQPRHLLPPTPRGYILSRARALAEGPCLAAFSWNGGGDWAHKPWSNELPTDSALVFYLFAAFLESPRWQFPLEEPQSHASTGGPLYLGSLPSKPAEQYFAVLPLRPPPEHKGANCMLELDMSTAQPRFTLMLQAEPVLTACSYVGVFHVILLFAQNVRLHHHGQLGGRTLDYLKLSPVLRPSEALYNLFAGKWFGLF